ncbi:chemotaxis protein CheB [Mucilaginibacter roseus]|uniref:protein-glutamate methylesterase n=1 Tax=Mucilaginibacter roseus TaxID=1528868 RepID=A0ABS8U1T2_9SPHI|nr:chemotaxis protein CheB [Mucilaginibacter roseus]MCD8740045.1 chemotaxis protein CheB [Mucilaginibacter roseus]
MAFDNNILQRWQQAEVLLIGGSAGSFKLFFSIVKHVDVDINKIIILVMHRKKNFFSEIEKLFSEHSRIYIKEIADKDVLQRNTIFIAPANYHTLIEKEGYFSLDVSDPVWYSKPSIDVTFDSAAEVFNERCVAILLSGANQDGAEGLLKLRQAGSLTIAQDPSEAEMAEMPRSAINLGAAELVLSAEDIYKLIRT